MDYYGKYGYEPALKQLKKIYSKSVITLQTYQRIQDDINTLQKGIDIKRVEDAEVFVQGGSLGA